MRSSYTSWDGDRFDRLPTERPNRRSPATLFGDNGPMRIVIVGGGQIGSSLARALAADHEVVVVDHDKAVADTFTNIDAELIVGSGTSEDVLERAGIRDARF